MFQSKWSVILFCLLGLAAMYLGLAYLLAHVIQQMRIL